LDRVVADALARVALVPAVELREIVRAFRAT
jgi:hypothetical protein